MGFVWPQHGYLLLQNLYHLGKGKKKTHNQKNPHLAITYIYFLLLILASNLH